MKKRTSARRAATFLAALGALVMSSGVALMVTTTPAHASEVKPSICHPVNGRGELGNGWDLISPDKASSHIDESLYPDGTYWKHESKDGRHDVYATDGQCPGEQIPQTYCPEDSTAHAGDPIPDGETEASYCNAPSGDDEPTSTTAGVTFTDPTCTTAASYATVNNPGVSYLLTGTVAAGQAVTVTASALPNYTITNEKVYPHTFTTPTGCSSVEGTTVVSPPKAVHHSAAQAEATTTAVTPTVVHAGLTSVSTQDMRGEQGLALMVSGMVMLAAAGGLGLRLRGAASRI